MCADMPVDFLVITLIYFPPETFSQDPLRLIFGSQQLVSSKAFQWHSRRINRVGNSHTLFLTFPCWKSQLRMRSKTGEDQCFNLMVFTCCNVSVVHTRWFWDIGDSQVQARKWPRVPSFLLNGDFPGGTEGKESACSAGDLGSIPGSGWFPAGGNGHPLQSSCPENPMDRGAWRGFRPPGSHRRRPLSFFLPMAFIWWCSNKPLLSETAVSVQRN